MSYVNGNSVLLCGRKRKRWLRAVSTLTLWFFLLNLGVGGDAFSGTAWALAPVGLLGSGSDNPWSADFSQGKFDVNDCSIPLRFGEIGDMAAGTNGRTIIHIQDAHCNYSAQHSIAGAIAHLNNTYGIDLVFLEGGKGRYDLSLFTGITDPDVREKVSDYFVKEGRVSGPEYFAINSAGKVELFGIEDPALYFKNLEAYRDSLSFKDDADRALAFLDHAIGNFKRRIYNGRMKEIKEKAKVRGEGENGFKEYVAFLAGKVLSDPEGLREFENVRSILDIFKAEDSIDFEKADKERDILIAKLAAKLSKRDVEDMAARAVRFKAGDITSTDFYGYLFRKAGFFFDGSGDFSESCEIRGICEEV